MPTKDVAPEILLVEGIGRIVYASDGEVEHDRNRQWLPVAEAAVG
jgi:hypothetical protein